MDQLVYSLQQIQDFLKQKNQYREVFNICGRKTINLCAAGNSGFKIPEGFVITQNALGRINKGSECSLSNDIWEKVEYAIDQIEKKTKLTFSGEDPLFLAVTNVAPTPGVVFVGMNDYTVRMLERKTNNRLYAYYCYSKFIRSYGSLVFNIPENEFDDLLDQYLFSRDSIPISNLKAQDWIQISKLFKSVIVRFSGKPLPQSPQEQLKSIIVASARHYETDFHKEYRSEILFDPNVGQAILVTAMKMGGANEKSCVGVASSHDIQTGEHKLSGLFGMNALIDDITEENFPVSNIDDLQKSFPNAFKELSSSINQVQKLIKGPVILKFVVENNVLIIVTVRKASFSNYGKFTAIISLVNSKAITSNEAIEGLDLYDLKSLLSKRIKNSPHSYFCHGYAAAHGAATGIISISITDTCSKIKRGQNVIHVKKRFYNSDIKALLFANGIITINGGLYSKAMFYSNAFCKPSAIGCKCLQFEERTFSCHDQLASIGDAITVSNGYIFIGTYSLYLPESIENNDAIQVMNWIDELRRGKLAVFTEIKSIDDIKVSNAASADGIGMFKIEKFIQNDAEAIVSYIESDDPGIGTEIENRLCSSFSDLFAAANDQVLSIQLINKALTSFLPNLEELVEQIATLKVQKQFSKSSVFEKEELLHQKEEILNYILSMKEENPLFGLHGARLSIVSPELFLLQVRSILKGARASRRRGANPKIRILLPMLTDASEISRIEPILSEAMIECEETAELVPMIENPRACFNSESISQVCSSLCLQSTILTESTYGICKYQAYDTFLNQYNTNKIFTKDPFKFIDKEGVGQLMKTCIENSKKINPNAFISIVGKNFSNPESIGFCYDIGVNAITVEPELTPFAKLCAAHAVLQKNR